MPEVSPPPLGRMNPLFSDPRGTYRGDLINKNDPLGLKYQVGDLYWKGLMDHDISPDSSLEEIRNWFLNRNKLN